jgi:hypothetical protein
MIESEWYRTAGRLLGEDEKLLTDEHVRYRLYLSALQGRTFESDMEVLQVVATDPDRAMAEAVFVHQLEAVAKSAASARQFHEWLEAHFVLLSNFDFAHRRAAEWLTCLKIEEDHDSVEIDLSGMSDWLQRRLASNSSSRKIVGDLAASGRTQRVRAEASERLRRLNGETADR